jgi:hypothetical protein
MLFCTGFPKRGSEGRENKRDPKKKVNTKSKKKVSTFFYSSIGLY